MHRIEMTYTGRNPHTGEARVRVEIDRDGGLEHAVDAFRAFLLAMGFEPDTIDGEVLRSPEGD